MKNLNLRTYWSQNAQWSRHQWVRQWDQSAVITTIFTGKETMCREGGGPLKGKWNKSCIFINLGSKTLIWKAVLRWKSSEISVKAGSVLPRDSLKNAYLSHIVICCISSLTLLVSAGPVMKSFCRQNPAEQDTDFPHSWHRFALVFIWQLSDLLS